MNPADAATPVAPDAARMWLRRANIVLTGISALVFALAFLLLLLAPSWLMEGARLYASQQAEAALSASMDALETRAGETALGRRALELARERAPDAAGRLGALRDSLDTAEAQALRERMVERILLEAGRLEALGMVAFPDDRLEPGAVDGLLQTLQANAAQRLERAREIVVNRYDGVLAALRRDALIMTGTTAAAALLALGLALVARMGRLLRHLLPVSVALSLATALCAYWYVFGQNWAWAILGERYVGWGYAVAIAVTFGYLMWLLLRHWLGQQINAQIDRAEARVFQGRGRRL